MREVLRHRSEVAHYWANAIQEKGRAGNVSFEGGDFYSYRTVIARRFDSQRFAVSAKRYSTSTTSHQAEARRAIPGSYITPLSVESVRNCLKETGAEVGSLLSRAAKARTKALDFINQAHAHINACNTFCEWMGSAERFDITPWPVLSDGSLLPALQAQAKEKAAKNKAEAKARQEQAKLELADTLQNWRNGGQMRHELGQVPPALRLMGDEVQTSHGASVPTAHAVRLWHLLQAKQARVGERVGHYEVRHINGGLTIGCHTFEWAEIEGFAAQHPEVFGGNHVEG